MLSRRIKALRLAHGLNQVELAKNLSVTKQTVSNWENNNIQPSVDMLVKLADFFSVSTDYLLCRDDKPMLCVEGLTNVQVAHVEQLIQDLRD